MRVIAGAWKGRRLRTPSWEGLRPSSDKLRETLFNVLAVRVPGGRVLDGYAGTGAVGIEALSRGAAHVTFVERDPRAIRLIEENLALCRASEESPLRYTVRRADVTGRLAMTPEALTLVFLDSPYADTHLTDALSQVRPAMAADGLLVLEHAARTPVTAPAGWQVTRTLASGDSVLTFFHLLDIP